ncbi:MAG: magnesium/cobalt transporter CorA [Candidatus Omnitrophica bacterium]|nr:magnesium/cobalt transporter CorA [Candidatus Omnitrophota bacterium]
MPRLYKRIKKVALPPGTLVRVDEQHKTLLQLFDYSAKHLQEKELQTVEESFQYKETDSISWINIDGRDVDVIRKMDEHFGIHPLVLEDVVNAGQRPKVEDYGDYLFFVVKMIYFDNNINDLYAEQVGLILGERFVISMQEKQGDVFEPIRNRIREGKGRVRQSGSDYLIYALVDAIVDHYFVVLEKIGEKIDAMENELLDDVRDDIPMRIHKLKTQIIFLRKQIWPLREVLAGIERMDSKLIDHKTQIFFRDVYDHTIQVNDTLEAFREALSGLHDIYLSTISNRMNEVMKVLTIFAAIFIPLTFMAGIYGMNFEYMPELRFRYGYFILLGLMALVGGGMLSYFKRKKWI